MRTSQWIKFTGLLFLQYAGLKESPAQSINSKPPNLLVVVLDDARYDMFKPNGGPDFFDTPAIDRIADEGINFKNTCATTALCGPSRASIYTGLYSHHHGVTDNNTLPKPGLNYVSTILKNAGYYTGFVGKYLSNSNTPDIPVGYNYWAVTDDKEHENPIVRFKDGSSINYTGHDAMVYTDLALDFLKNKVPSGKPWLLFVCHRVPHTPYQPLPQDSLLYQHSQISFPENFYPYEKEFPSYLYPGHKYEGDSTLLDQDIRDYYETCHSAEYSMDSILGYLEEENLLDSTMIIFTSDNGYLMGEHDLDKKILSYEESIRLPLFIRYPAWFTAGKIVNDAFALNIDIAPTLLDAAGIPNTYNMDGVSLRKLANGEIQRKYFLYEYYPITLGESWDAVCSLDYKYIYSYCSTLTEEFYDLNTDPEENTNLIFNPGYSVLIQEFRNRIDSLRMATDDTAHPEIGNCHYEFTAYADSDYDGYGNAYINIQDDELPPGYVLNKGDCNDYDSLIHPDAPDVCNNIDDNCNGIPDENSITATIDPSGSISICAGSEITLTANIGMGLSYQWRKNSATIAGATNTTYTTNKTGRYSVSETNTYNCNATSATTMVSMAINPTATITPLGDLNICATGSVDLKANDGPGLSYQWKKGNNLISGATSQIYTATKKATYKVIVSNGSGCSKTSTGAIVTKSCKEGIADEYMAGDELIIYPIPAKERFIMELFSDTIADEVVSVEIVNMFGQIIYSKKTAAENGLVKEEIAPDHPFPNGIYLLKIISDQRTFAKKIILQH